MAIHNIIDGEDAEIVLEKLNAVIFEANKVSDNSALDKFIRSESTAFSLSIVDGHKYIRYTGDANINLTVPNTILLGQPIKIWQAGIGIVTLIADTDVTLNSVGEAKTLGKNTVIEITKTADGIVDVIQLFTGSYTDLADKPTDVTDLSKHNATELIDILNVGSGSIITAAERTKLEGIETGADVNIHSDWDQTVTSSTDYIKNKPDLSLKVDKNPVNVTVDTLDDTSIIQFWKTGIRKITWGNIKSTLDTIYSKFSGSYNDLADKPSDITDLSLHASTELSDTAFLAYLNAISNLFTGDVVISGSLTVNGDTTTLSAQTVEVKDNLLVINEGETGAGVTATIAGIEVDRGTSGNYQFVFDEASDSFKVGEVGSLQTVATREDTPLANGNAYWDATDNMFKTRSNAFGSDDADKLGGQLPAYYTNIIARLEYTPVNKAGDTMTGNLSIEGNISATNLNLSNWNTAYTWGDHSVVGYITSYTETDPIYTKDRIVQSLTALNNTWDINNGHNAKIFLAEDTTITMSNLVSGTTGTLSIVNPLSSYSITFAVSVGLSVKLSSSLHAINGAIKLSGQELVESLKWHFDGTNLIVNGVISKNKIREESSSFVLTKYDGNSYIRYNGTTNINVTVPNTLLEGQPIDIRQSGIGVVSLIGDTGVILNTYGEPKTLGQNTTIRINKIKSGIIDVTHYADTSDKPTDITDLSLHSATELNDIDSAGSGSVITDIERTKLGTIEENADVNVQSDWDQTLIDSDDFIKNKPDLSKKMDKDPASVTTDILTDESVIQFWKIGSKKILWGNIKTALKTYFDGIYSTFSGSYSDLTNKPTDLTDLSTHSATELNDITSAGSGAIITAIERTKLNDLTAGGDENIQADWNQTVSTEDDYIKNKPTDLTDLSLHASSELSDSNILAYLNAISNLFAGDVVIGGSLTVNGDTTTLSAQTVEVKDNLLLLNDGETGAGVTAVISGIEVDRGTSVNYQFIFDEASDSFKIGEVGSLQSVATREDTPLENGHAYWDATNSMFKTRAKAFDSDKLEGHTASEFQLVVPTGNHTNLAIGWYTIAVNIGDRAIARFGIRDTNSGDHQSAIFYASHHFGAHSEITVLHSGHFSGSPYRHIRIKEGGTYDGAMLQVYIDDASNSVQAYLLGENFQTSGWVLKDFVPDGLNPGGLNNFASLTNVAASIDLDNIIDGGMATTGELYAGGSTVQNKVWHAGNFTPSGKSDTGHTHSTAEISDISSPGSGNIITDAERTKLGGIATGAEVNVQSDWASASGDDFIKNKPTVITSAERTKLGGIATGAEVNVQSDWSLASGDGFIKNKPTDLTDLSLHASTELSDSGVLAYLNAISNLFTGDVVISGNLTINGSSTVINAETVEVKDNLLIINDGETGTGVTAVIAGIEVDRGTSTNYQFIFDEATDTFKIGQVGSLQTVATREDTPLTNGHAYWDNTTSMFKTRAKAFDSDKLGGQLPSYYTAIISRLGYTPVNKAGDTLTGNIYASNLSGTNTGDQDLTNYLNRYTDETIYSNHSFTKPIASPAFVSEENGGIYIASPGGAKFETQSSSFTGYLKITLPVSWTSTMMRMAIDIFTYTSDSQITIYLGGYNYGTTPAWVNTFAQTIASSSSKDYNVRFGHDGTKCAIYIGESTTSWPYPQAVVRDFYAGFNGATKANWADGWSIGYTTTLGTITKTHSNNYLYSDWNRIKNKPSELSNPVSGSGTTNYLTKWSGTSALGNSSIYDNGNILIGKITDSGEKLQVVGNGLFTGSISEGGTALISKYLGISAKAADSDKLDNLNSTQFLRSDANDAFTGTYLDFGTAEIRSQANYVKNRRFNLASINSGTLYILLCGNSGGNDVNGRITMARTSGLRHACQTDIIVSAGTSALPVGTIISHGVSGAGAPSYRLVTCIYNTVSHVALEITNPDSYYDSSGAYFEGRIVDTTGNNLIGVLPADVSSVASFSINGSHQIDGSTIWHSGNFNPSSKLDATAKAVDSDKLGGVVASKYLQRDVSETITAPYTFSTNNNPIKIGPNSTYSGILLLGGWSSTITEARVAASTGNLHLDSKSSTHHMYLNHYHTGNVYVASGGGKVGIGTSSPNEKLDVAGKIKFRGYWNSSDITGNAIYTNENNLGFGFGNGTTVSTWFAYNGTTNRMIDVWNDGSAISLGGYNSAKIGIGSVTLTEKLNVGGNGKFTGSLTIAPSTGRATIKLITQTDEPNDLWFGNGGANKWSITSRASNENNDLSFYSTDAGHALNINYTTGDVTANNKIISENMYGVFGKYDSTKVQGIWSMGSQYTIDKTNNDFGNQWGINYAHTNAGTTTTSKPLADFSHQLVFTGAGVRKAAISLQYGTAWFLGNVTAPRFIGLADNATNLGGVLASKYLQRDVNETITGAYNFNNVGNMFRGHMYIYANEGEGNNGTAYIQARDNSGSSIQMKLRTQLNGTSYDVLTLKTDRTAYFHDKLGIGGITTPTRKLQVAGDGYDTFLIHPISQTYVYQEIAGYTGNDSGLVFSEWDGSSTSRKMMIGWDSGGNYMRFYNYGSGNIMTLSRTGNLSLDGNVTAVNGTFSGNVTVGSTSSSNRIIKALAGDSYAAGFEAYGNSQGTGYLFVGQSPSYGGGIEYNGDGTPDRVGAGSDYITLYRRSNNVSSWTARNLHSNNNWEFRGNVTATDYILSSDRRKKENISSIKTNDTDFVEIKEFSFKEDETKRKRYGVIADELEEVHPELVTEDSEGFKQVSYIDLLLLKVAALEKRIEQLENKEK